MRTNECAYRYACTHTQIHAQSSTVTTKNYVPLRTLEGIIMNSQACMFSHDVFLYLASDILVSANTELKS